MWGPPLRIVVGNDWVVFRMVIRRADHPDSSGALRSHRRTFSFPVDGFVLAILGAVGVASLLPISGVAAVVFDDVTTVAIAVLFFMYGGRLSREEVWAGFRHWQLHLMILGFTFVVFPVIGQVLRLLEPWMLSPELMAGVLFLCAVPSTVQSSITFTSISGGNVAGAVVSASLSNLLGVVITPVLVVITMGGAGGFTISGSSVVDLVLHILVPFLVGQCVQPWVSGWLKRNHAWLKRVDQGIIVAVVYSAFSRGMVERMWSRVSVGDLVVLVLVVLVVLVFVLWLTWWLSGVLGFEWADRVAIQFCGTKKSLATGVPMALVLFPGAMVGLMVLPIMLFHQAQLMVCAVLARRHSLVESRQR